MLGHYNRLCHIITRNTHEMWGLIYSRAMKTISTSCHVLPHVQQRHARIVQCVHTGMLAALCIHGAPEITYGLAMCAS